MIKYITGDATSPIGEGNKLIIHVCNDLGGWGSGFVIALSRKWSYPEDAYRAMSKEERQLGEVQLVYCGRNEHGGIFVGNMIAQHGIGFDENGIAPIRYDAVRECLKKMNEFAIKTQSTIHAPRFGAGLAGGEWSKIEELIKENITVDVTIYDLK